MERFTRKNLWLLSGALILVAAPVGARTLDLLTDFKLTRFIPGLAPERERSTREDSAIVIERERIIIPAGYPRAGGHVEEARSAQVARAPAPSQDTGAPCGGIRAVSEHAYEVPGEDVRDAFARLEELATQARVVPAFREGKPQGFKMFAIRPHSLFAKLGLQNGDIIRRVNGQSLTTPQTALEAFESLRETKHIELDLERGGAPLKKTYDVR